MKALTDLKIIVSRGDDLSLRRAITYFLNNIARQTQEQETIAAIGEDIFAVALDQPFRSGYIKLSASGIYNAENVLLWKGNHPAHT